MPMGQMIKPFLPNPLTFLRICLDCPSRNIQRMSRQINPYPHFISIESRQSRRSRQIIGQATTSGYRDLPGARTKAPRSPSRQRPLSRRIAVQTNASNAPRARQGRTGKPSRHSRAKPNKFEQMCPDNRHKTDRARHSDSPPLGPLLQKSPLAVTHTAQARHTKDISDIRNPKVLALFAKMNIIV